MNFEEFIRPDTQDKAEEITNENLPIKEETESTEIVQDHEMALDVQKAVVESLAADKAEQDEHISSLRKQNYEMQSEISSLKDKISEMQKALAQVGDVLANNSDIPLSNKLTLLERSIEINDRFPGETRDHVIEVLKEARDVAEKNGRLRRAQILESVLVDNEASGELQKRRAELQKIFSDNQNIVSGPVINELDKLGISHKCGDNYLLPSEIINRTY